MDSPRAIFETLRQSYEDQVYTYVIAFDYRTGKLYSAGRKNYWGVTSVSTLYGAAKCRIVILPGAEGRKDYAELMDYVRLLEAQGRAQVMPS